VVQSHFLDAMPTAIVAPMLIAAGRTPYKDIGAPVEFEGEAFIVSVGELAAIDIRHLRSPIGALLECEDAIRRALERLLSGF
jgi:hypothetical protein